MLTKKKKIFVIMFIIMVLLAQLGCTDEMIEEIKQEIGEEVSKEFEKTREDISRDISESKDKAIDDAREGLNNFYAGVLDDLKEWFDSLLGRAKDAEPDPEDPNDRQESSPAEIAQRKANQMTVDKFEIWKRETGWCAENGWPPLPDPINISTFTTPQKVDSFYGIDAMVRNELYLGYVGEAEGRYACAEYIKRFYQANDQHKLFGNMLIENVSSLLPGEVPIISYYDNGTFKTSAMTEVDIAGGDLPRPGDICYKFAHGFGHWTIVRGVDLETKEVVIIEQNYHDGTLFQPARRIMISSCTFFTVPW